LKTDGIFTYFKAPIWLSFFAWQTKICLYFRRVKQRLGFLWMTRSSGCYTETA